MKIKIADVAKKAGVSTATVDRVLNKRGNVRKVTIDKVEKAALALSYEPNLLASRLAKGKVYHLGFILPLGENHFMEGLYNNIIELSHKVKSENVSIQVKRLNIWHKSVAEELLEAAESWDGIAVVAADSAEMNLAINELSEKIPVVTLVSDAPSSRRIVYVGIDNLVAGRTAASLMGRFLPKDEISKIAIIMASPSLRDHAERKAGFEQVIHKEYPYLEILAPLYSLDDYRRVESSLLQLHIEHKDLRAIYSIGAGNRGLLEFLKTKTPSKRLKVIAHELSDVTKRALIDGYFDAILCQNAQLEAAQAVQILLHALENKNIQNVSGRSNVDIYLRDNLPL